jgi:uncharacterized protein
MDIPDVNILVNAFRPDLKHHRLCRDWIENKVSDASRFGMSTLVLSGFIRIVTNSKIFSDPNTAEEALDFAEAISEQPNCVVVSPGELHWDLFVSLCREYSIAGNLVPDAYFAALATEHSCSWVTMDRDFRMFKKLKVEILSE